MTTSAQRFYIRSPDGRMIVGFDDLNAAGAVALDYGGADANARDAEGTSALDLALERNNPALVELLQRAGSTPSWHARSERRVLKDIAMDRST